MSPGIKSKHKVKVLHFFFAGIMVLNLIGCAAGQSPRRNYGNNPSTPATAPLGHYEIKRSDLPAPKIEDGVNNGPRIIARPEGAKLNMPPRFEISTFAEGGFTRPRWMALAPNGDVF